MFAAIPLMAQQTEFQQFAMRLLENVAKDNSDNLVVSPLSAQLGLGMLMNGAAGTTQAEIMQAMGVEKYTTEQVNEYNKGVMDKLTEEKKLPSYYYDPDLVNPNSFPKLESANGIWSNVGYDMKESFAETCKAYYNAYASTLDLSEQSSIDKIDQWVSDKTQGLVPNSGLAPNPEYAIVMASSLYFKASWNEFFDERETYDAPFRNASGEKVMMPTMHEKTKMGMYSETEKWRATYKDLGNNDVGRYHVRFFLAKEGYEDCVPTYGDWLASATKSKNAEVWLSVPKFNYKCDINLHNVLKTMGINTAFGEDADFSGMLDSKSYLSDAKQLGSIGMDERGVSVGVVFELMTMGAVDSEIQVMDLNRPFYYIIDDGKTILYAGRVSQLDGPSAISNVASSTSTNDAIYDLTGRKLSAKPAKGIYIKNGKKIVE